MEYFYWINMYHLTFKRIFFTLLMIYHKYYKVNFQKVLLHQIIIISYHIVMNIEWYHEWCDLSAQLMCSFICDSWVWHPMSMAMWVIKVLT